MKTTYKLSVCFNCGLGVGSSQLIFRSFSYRPDVDLQVFLVLWLIFVLDRIKVHQVIWSHSNWNRMNFHFKFFC